MPDSAVETRLAALFTLADTAFPGDALRNEPLPAEVPAGGLLQQMDGSPGVPQVILSPLGYAYDHEVSWEVTTRGGTPAARAAAADTARRALGAAVAANRTLDGLVDWMEVTWRQHDEIAIEGAEVMRGDTLAVTLSYTIDAPLT
jgi:hypothetical protein